MLPKENPELEETLQNLLILANVLQNSTKNHIRELKHRIDDFNAFQLSIIAFLMDLFSKTSGSVAKTELEFRNILHLLNSPTSLLVKILQKPIEENNLSERII